MTTALPATGETAPPAIRPTGAALAFNPVLHGLRGLAAMAVLLYHWRGSYPALAKAWQDLPFLGTTWDPLFLVQFGWIGVNWFFVLSGYLLAANLWRAPLNPGQVLRFYQRRALRIYPGLWAQLLILLPFVYLTGLVSDFRWQQVLGNALLWFAPMPGGTAIYNGVYWTLPLELSFYLALPFMILFYRRTGVWILLFASLSITLVWRFGIAGLHHSSFSFHPSLLFIRNVLPGVLFVFATGFAINHFALRLSDGARQRMLLLVAALYLGFHYVLLGKKGVALQDDAVLLLSDLVLSLLIAGMIALMLQPLRGCGWLASRPLVWLGEVSFGVYLWHFPVQRLLPKLFPGLWGTPSGSALALLVCLLITLPLAAASYRWIEKPVLDRFARSPKRTPEPVVT